MPRQGAAFWLVPETVSYKEGAGQLLAGDSPGLELNSRM